MEQIAKALELKMELDTLRPIDKEREAIIMQKLRLDWDYHSNHLEGNSLTFGETKALIMFGITAQGKPLHDHLEITGHDEAIKWITEIVKGEYPLTETFIRELHILLLKEPYEVNAITPDGNPTKKRIEIGKYKSVPNHVKTSTGEIFRFAAPEETPAKMQALIEWYRQKKEARDINPVLLAAEFHYRFICIHPFDDGNGRVARILMNFILMQYGFPPAIIKTDDKVNYFAALQQADSGIYEPFFDYIAKNLVRSLEIMIAGARGESIEEPDDLDKELTLLEQKVNAAVIKKKITKSPEAILDIYDDTVARIYKLFYYTIKKFERFYSYKYPRFRVATDGVDVSDATDSLSSLREKIDIYTGSISLTYRFVKFKQREFTKSEFTNQIEIRFYVERYKVMTDKWSSQKQYGEQLTDEEVNDLIKSEVKRHKDLIALELEIVNKKKTK